MAKKKQNIDNIENTNLIDTTDTNLETELNDTAKEELEQSEEQNKKKTKKDRKVKCPNCGAYNSKEIAICKGGKYYCSTCYETIQKEADDYKDLISFVCKLFDTKAPNIAVLNQIKEYKEKYKFTYRGMKTTLDYFYNIKGNPTELYNRKVNSVGIIPYVYEEAKEFYQERAILNPDFSEEKAQEIEDNCCYIDIQVDSDETILPSSYGMIDISELLAEE